MAAAGLPILMYDAPNNRFIKSSELISPGISATTNAFMREIRAGDSCKDANITPKVGLYNPELPLTEFIYNTIYRIGRPAGVNSLGTGDTHANNLETPIINLYRITEAQYDQFKQVPQNYFWDAGSKPENNSTMMKNAASEFDPHSGGNGTRVNTTLTINHNELYLVGLADTPVVAAGAEINQISLDESAGRYNFTNYTILNFNLFTYAASLGSDIPTLFSSSANSTKYNYIAQTTDRPFPPLPYTQTSSIQLDPTSYPLICKFLTKEMGDTFQVISLNKCLTTYLGINPLKTFMYTNDNGTFLSCTQLSVPSLAHIGNNYYMYPGCVTITQANMQIIANNYIETALNLVNHGIRYVINQIDTYLSLNIRPFLRIHGINFPLTGMDNQQDCINFYRLGMYRLLLYHMVIKRAIRENQANINQLITGIGLLDAYAIANPDPAVADACTNDKSVLANFIKDYYLEKVMSQCLTCNQIGGSNGILTENFKLLVNYNNATNIINLYKSTPLPSLTPNLDMLMPLTNDRAGINALYINPVVSDIYEYVFYTKIFNTYDKLIDCKCIFLNVMAASPNSANNVVRISEYMAVCGNDIYTQVVHELSLYGYNCIPINTFQTAPVISAPLLAGGNLNKIKKSTKKLIKNKIKHKIKKSIKKGGSFLSKRPKQSAENIRRISLNRRAISQMQKRASNKNQKKTLIRNDMNAPELDAPELEKIKYFISMIFKDVHFKKMIGIGVIKAYCTIYLSDIIISSYTSQNSIKCIMTYALPQSRNSSYLRDYKNVFTVYNLSLLHSLGIIGTEFPIPTEEQYNSMYLIVIQYINNSYDNLCLIHEDVCSLYVLYMYLNVGKCLELLQIENYEVIIKYKHLYVLKIVYEILTHYFRVEGRVVSLETPIRILLENEIFVFCMNEYNNSEFLENRINIIIKNYLLSKYYDNVFTEEELRVLTNTLYTLSSDDPFNLLCELLIQTFYFSPEKKLIQKQILMDKYGTDMQTIDIINSILQHCIQRRFFLNHRKIQILLNSVREALDISLDLGRFNALAQILFLTLDSKLDAERFKILNDILVKALTGGLSQPEFDVLCTILSQALTANLEPIRFKILGEILVKALTSRLDAARFNVLHQILIQASGLDAARFKVLGEILVKALTGGLSRPDFDVLCTILSQALTANLEPERFKVLGEILIQALTIELDSERFTVLRNILVKAITLATNTQSFINLSRSLFKGLSTQDDIEWFRQLGLNNDPDYHIAVYPVIIANFPPDPPENNNEL